MTNWWRIWCKSLGTKASHCNKESDKVAIVRTLIFLSYFITNGFIIANAIRHWVPVREVSTDCSQIQNHR